MLISRYVERCDRSPGQKNTVTDYPTSVTRHLRSGSVTVVLLATRELLAEAEHEQEQDQVSLADRGAGGRLMSCSARTVWRYIKRNQIEVHKHLVEQDGYKVRKTFLLTEPSLYIKEMAGLPSQKPGACRLY